MTRLNNRYFAMRHGQSMANEQGLIISDPTNGVLAEYGLSEIGRQQSEISARNSDLKQNTVIYTSDFSRALQTAEIVRRIIGADSVTATSALRERYFGNWEKTPNSNYEKVWQLDRTLSDRHENNVESLDAVLARTLVLIATLELEYHNRDVLLVSHGDTLQILQAGLGSYSLTKHRDLPHLQTAEIRLLTQ